LWKKGGVKQALFSRRESDTMKVPEGQEADPPDTGGRKKEAPAVRKRWRKGGGETPLSHKQRGGEELVTFHLHLTRGKDETCRGHAREEERKNMGSPLGLGFIVLDRSSGRSAKGTCPKKLNPQRKGGRTARMLLRQERKKNPSS